MKKKTLLITIGAILVIAGAVIAAILINRDAAAPKTDNAQTTTDKADAQRFATEYTSVTADNVFVYRDADEIIRIMKKGTGVVYLGFPECPWCQAYVEILNDVAKEEGLDTIYYFNISDDRKNNTEKYQEIVALLGDNLQFDNEGNPRIFVPNVSFHVNGELVGNNHETSKDTLGLDSPEDYWTDERANNLKDTLRTYMKKVIDAGSCDTICNEK